MPRTYHRQRYTRNGQRFLSNRYRAEIERRRSAGLVLVARGTYDLKEQIKSYGGLWDSESRGWAMPDVSTYNRFAAMLGVALIYRPAIRVAGEIGALSELQRQQRGNTFQQPTADRCGSCKNLIADEFGCTVGEHYSGPAVAGSYEECPRCGHAYHVS